MGLIGGFGDWGPFKDGEILAILSKRDEVKGLRDWATADKIRDELRSRGIEVSVNRRCQSTFRFATLVLWRLGFTTLQMTVLGVRQGAGVACGGRSPRLLPSSDRRP